MRTTVTIAAIVALIAGAEPTRAQDSPGTVRHPEGSIAGVVLGAGGLPLANQRVELALPSSRGLGRLVTTTNEEGKFVFTKLGLGRHQAEWLIRGEVVVREDIKLSGSAMRIDNLTLALLDAKAFVGDLGTGQSARVNVKLLDGTRVTGYVRAMDDDSLTVTNSNRFQTVTIRYNDVLSISRGRSELTKLLIFMGVAFGVAAAGIAVAVTAAGGV
jgi:hypothetical protein